MNDPREDERELRSGLQGRPRLVIQAVVVLCIAIFATDSQQPRVIAISALYAIPVLVSLWMGSRRFTLGVASACMALALLGLVFGKPSDIGASATARSEELMMIAANRAAAIFSIAIVTSLGLMRLRVERKLYDTREAATTTLRSIADAVITIDTRGRISFLNAVAEHLTGWSRGDAVGRELESVFRVLDEHPSRPPIVELVQDDLATAVEGVLVTRDGRRITIEERRSPIRDTDGAVHGHVLVFRDVTARHEHEEAMRRLAYRDELTGLPNRTSLTDRLQLELAHARRNRESLALLYVDLDQFKEINDRFGHHAGDALLRSVADRLRGALRAGDTVARLGGDEFTVLLPGLSGPEEARRVGDKVLEALSGPVDFEGQDLASTASIGISLYPRDGDEVDTLLRRADKAMYRAKQLGGARVELHGGEAPAAQAAR